MLSEDFDKKVRDAADHHHPAYDEKAWTGMKRLLEKYMPEQKDRKRRFIFILLLPLLLAGGAWFLFDQLSADKKKQEVISTNGPSGNSAAGNQAGTSTQEKDNQPNPVNNPDSKQPVTPSQNNNEKVQDINAVPAADNNTDASSAKEKSQELTIATGGGQKKQKDKRQTIAQGSKTPVRKKTGNENIVTVSNPPVSPPSVPEGTTPPAEAKYPSEEPGIKAIKPADPVAGNTSTKKEAQPEKPEIRKAEVAVVKNQPQDPVKKANKKKSTFFFAVTAAPDLSFTGKGQPGTVKILGGAGIGFTYKERLTLRTGFYSGRKVYTAMPGEYKLNSWQAAYYPNLQKVGADCKVYEIPVLLSYNFGAAKRHSWFVSAGASTLIMKRETYDYYYKYYPAGPTVNKAFTIRNQNKHPFSIMTLSAGYKQNITKRISLIAEPYFKLPLTGIGAGKVKLNSAGVSFTVTANPFGQGNKK